MHRPLPRGGGRRTGHHEGGLNACRWSSASTSATPRPRRASPTSRTGTVGRLASSLTRTTGVKGTPDNTTGAVTAVRRALEAAGRPAGVLATVLLNEATPVISGLAMETITETIITESTMIGHNPDTPGGDGLGVGMTVSLDDLAGVEEEVPVVVVVGAGADFDDVAHLLNKAGERGVDVVAAVLHGDDAVLVVNRLTRRIPVVDEVSAVDRVPLGMLAAVEVAAPGRTIRTLSDSYGLASTFDLDAEQTRQVSPVARALSGNRSAVVVRTPAGDVTDRRIPVGTLTALRRRALARRRRRRGRRRDHGGDRAGRAARRRARRGRHARRRHAREGPRHDDRRDRAAGLGDPDPRRPRRRHPRAGRRARRARGGGLAGERRRARRDGAHQPQPHAVGGRRAVRRAGLRDDHRRGRGRGRRARRADHARHLGADRDHRHGRRLHRRRAARPGRDRVGGARRRGRASWSPSSSTRSWASRTGTPRSR